MTAVPLVSMREALADPLIFGSVLSGESWSAWRALLIAAAGEPLAKNERKAFKRLTGRSREPQERVEELFVVAGRRSGKTRIAAVLAVYYAALVDYSKVLAVGEARRPTVPLGDDAAGAQGIWLCRRLYGGIAAALRPRHQQDDRHA
jgi:hypothetical protein